MPRARRSPAPPKGASARGLVFPIAVAGGAAGGFEALERLLSALPAESGMGLILVPHLDPTRESHLAERLAAASAAPIMIAENGRRVAPNHIYVLPPNRLLEVHRGRLVLRPLPHPAAGRTALDVALRSLAADQGANAVGIVLSGAGAHGAAGLAAVLQAGGLGLAQDPMTARFGQMPRSAAAAGVPPAHVLAPERMAAVLLAHARHLAQGSSSPRTAPSRFIRFFRDADKLDGLAARALASVVDRATAARPLRIWVPECGTGEEAYSVAILLLERLTAAGKDGALRVLATDADEKPLGVAQRGVYPASIARMVSRERLARFFTRLPTGRHQVSRELRQTVVFGPLDFFADPPISKLDLLVWRARSSHGRLESAGLIPRLNLALQPGGYLLLAGARPAVVACGQFETVSEKAALYRKVGAIPSPQRREPLAAKLMRDRDGKSPRAVGRRGDVAEFMSHAVREKLAPAAILMTARYRILATRGPVTKYFRVTPHEPLPSLLTAADASLRGATQAACEEAVRRHRWVGQSGIRARRNGRYLRCGVAARSLRGRSGARRLLLVIFEDRSGHGHRHEPSGTDLRTLLADLELASDDLEASSEQKTEMNEELRAASEELQSSNEEVRGVDEEMERSRATPQGRAESSERLEAQLRAVLDATADAVVTITPDGMIVTFNGSASRMFGYALHEVIGRNVNMLMPPEWRALHDEYLARYRDTRRLHIIGMSREVVAYRRNGSRFPALLSISETADATLLVGCLRDLTEDKALQEEILHIAALEQQRIGQELHDGTQQQLTGLGLLAQSLSDELRQHGGPNAALARRVADGIAEANRQVRALARGLVPTPIEADALPSALGELARRTQETCKLSCRLDCAAPVKVADAATATHLYRIAQEAVGNAVKHAKADAVVIALSSEDRRLRLEIQDNGTGIPAQPVVNWGVGLRLMEHRCTAIGGRFTLEPRAGGGTVVSCIVPYQRRP